MQKYKEVLRKGFTQRAFELTQIEKEIDTLPWWIEEIWTIISIRRINNNTGLFVTFLTEKSWENGTKNVAEVLVSTSKLKHYSDIDTCLLSLDMRKGNFEDKLVIFWKQFDNSTKTLS